MTIDTEIHLVAPPTTSIPRILYTNKYDGNEIALARDLNVRDALVRSYRWDKHGSCHVVRMYDGQLQLLVLAPAKPKRRKKSSFSI